MAEILVVDDETPVLQLITEILSQDGHKVTQANNGVDGIEKYQKGSFEIVITDLVMPEKSGLDLIMELRKINPDIKILAISGGGGIQGRFDYLPIAKLVGAVIIIKKPFQISEIREAIATLL